MIKDRLRKLKSHIIHNIKNVKKDIGRSYTTKSRMPSIIESAANTI